MDLLNAPIYHCAITTESYSHGSTSLPQGTPSIGELLCAYAYCPWMVAQALGKDVELL